MKETLSMPTVQTRITSAFRLMSAKLTILRDKKHKLRRTERNEQAARTNESLLATSASSFYS